MGSLRGGCPVAKVTTIGLDIAKQVFQAHGANKAGRRVVRRKLRRSEVARFFSEQPPFLVAIMASGSPNYLGSCALLVKGRPAAQSCMNEPRNSDPEQYGSGAGLSSSDGLSGPGRDSCPPILFVVSQLRWRSFRVHIRYRRTIADLPWRFQLRSG